MSSETIYGLNKKDLFSALSLISENERIRKIILFGSRAIGNFTPGSDIDIALMGDDIKLNDTLEASISIDRLLLPYKFDLVIYNRIKEDALKEHIKRVGITLFDQDSKIRDKTQNLS